MPPIKDSWIWTNRIQVEIPVRSELLAAPIYDKAGDDYAKQKEAAGYAWLQAAVEARPQEQLDSVGDVPAGGHLLCRF